MTRPSAAERAPTRPSGIEIIRLWTRAAGLSAPVPPLGIRAWDPGASAMAVWLDATKSDLATVAEVAEQIPDAQGLPERTPIVVLGTAARAPSGWRRLLGVQRVPVAHELRCSALLVRGYVDIGGDADADLAWGWSSFGGGGSP
jgi:hypothetical protein